MELEALHTPHSHSQIATPSPALKVIPNGSHNSPGGGFEGMHSPHSHPPSPPVPVSQGGHFPLVAPPLTLSPGLMPLQGGQYPQPPAPQSPSVHPQHPQGGLILPGHRNPVILSPGSPRAVLAPPRQSPRRMPLSPKLNPSAHGSPQLF